MDPTGKTVVVTGADTGLELECVKHLQTSLTALDNYSALTDRTHRASLQASHLILASREIKKGEVAVAAVLKETRCKTGTKSEVCDLDLSSYDSTLFFRKRVCIELSCLEAFISNAGLEVQTF